MAKNTIRPPDHDWPENGVPDDEYLLGNWDDDNNDDEEDDSAGADFDQFIASIHGMEEHELKLVEIAVAWARGHQNGLPKRKGKK